MHHPEGKQAQAGAAQDLHGVQGMSYLVQGSDSGRGDSATQLTVCPLTSHSLACQVFGKHVHRWIETSQAGLCMRCQQIEASGYATAMLADHAKEGTPNAALD